MRDLTIQRRKTFVGSLVAMKVYIEDPEAGELTIQGVSCRKLGELKNAEEKTFSIGEEAARVFVIAGNMSKNYCSDYYQLPAGSEPIALSGKNHFNLANGNAFLFDDNPNPESIAARKKNKKTGLIVLAVSCVIGLLAGWFIGNAVNSADQAASKVFSSNGMTVTLNGSFREVDIENYTAAYDSREVAVLALKESFSLAEGFENNTLEEYADLVIQVNGLDTADVKTKDGLTYFIYDAQSTEDGKTYRYYAYVYKSDDAFWMLQFATQEKNAEKYQQKIHEWAKSVSFAE